MLLCQLHIVIKLFVFLLKHKLLLTTKQKLTLWMQVQIIDLVIWIPNVIFLCIWYNAELNGPNHRHEWVLILSNKRVSCFWNPGVYWKLSLNFLIISKIKVVSLSIFLQSINSLISIAQTFCKQMVKLPWVIPQLSAS